MPEATGCPVYPRSPLSASLLHVRQKPRYERGHLDAPVTRQDVAAYADGGNSTLKGQAFLRQESGKLVTCAGSEVLLMPDVAWTREVIHQLRQGKIAKMRVNGERPSKMFPQAFRKKWCKRDGEFEFARLAPGPWILMTHVTWKAGYALQGGIMVGFVEVPEGGVEEVVLSSGHLM